MANSLLDFVISLVRDPDVAARYAANPAQSIADAHLTDVTSMDVNNLIPMVTDSLATATPAGPARGCPSRITETSGQAERQRRPWMRSRRIPPLGRSIRMLRPVA